MKKKLKLNKIKLTSTFEKLTELQMLRLTGGSSCSTSGSSSSCDGTAVCSCHVNCGS